MSRFLEVVLDPSQVPGILKRRTKHLGHRVAGRCQRLYWQSRYCFNKLPSVELDLITHPLDEPLNLIMDHICLPPYYGPKTHDDVTPLMRIIKHLNPKIVLEFGTAHGNTVANVCNVCDAYVFTINALPEQMSGHMITFALNDEEIGSVYRRYGFQNRVRQIYANTLEFDYMHYFKKPCVDLAIIDACHDTEYVINDFMKGLPALNTRATVLLHDTHPSMAGHLAGSYLACLKLRRRGFDIRHIRGTWWAIWDKR